MIYDILEVFKKEYEKRGDGLILGSYTLKDGLYVKINKDETLEFFESKTVKKEKVFSNLEGIQDSNMQEWFAQRDYYSNVIETAKAYDAPIKSIHNNNYITLFMKADKFIDVKIEHIKNKLFLTVLSFNNFTNKKNKDKEIICIYRDIINIISRKKDIVKKYKIIKNELEKIKQKVKDLDIKDYIKIFFEEDLELYKKESEIYLSLKIFNKNEYNKKIENKLYGLSNSNVGLNTKKPFLENRTRKNSLPFLIENENALMLKKFFDWLKVQPYNQDRTLDEEHFFIQKKSSNDEAEITDFDYIPIKKDDVNKYFPSIYIKNYLELVDKDKKIISDYELKELWQLEDKVDELFYNRQLKYNYYKDTKDIKVSDFLSKELQSILFITKFVMINYFKKYDDIEFLNIIKKYGTHLIINHLIHERDFKAKETMNLKLSLEGENMDIQEELQNIRNILLNEDEYKNLSKNEFLFLSGQWAYYLLSLSRADNKNKTLALAEQYFKAKSISKIQSILNNDLAKFKYTISLNNSKIRKTIATLKSYENSEKLSNSDKDKFLVGFMAKNIFY